MLGRQHHFGGRPRIRQDARAVEHVRAESGHIEGRRRRQARADQGIRVHDPRRRGPFGIDMPEQPEHQHGGGFGAGDRCVRRIRRGQGRCEMRVPRSGIHAAETAPRVRTVERVHAHGIRLLPEDRQLFAGLRHKQGREGRNLPDARRGRGTDRLLDRGPPDRAGRAGHRPRRRMDRDVPAHADEPRRGLPHVVGDAHDVSFQGITEAREDGFRDGDGGR